MKVNQMDQNLLLFDTNAKIKSATNNDFISEVYNSLREKEKEYIQNVSKNYIK